MAEARAPGCSTYASGLLILRRSFLDRTVWGNCAVFTPAMAQGFNLHSTKTCLLSTSAQIPEISEQARAAQGHRRGSVGFFNQSVRVYSRDDVFPSVHLQTQVLARIGQGWRPLRPQSRGGQASVPDVAFATRTLNCLFLAFPGFPGFYHLRASWGRTGKLRAPQYHILPPRGQGCVALDGASALGLQHHPVLLAEGQFRRTPCSQTRQDTAHAYLAPMTSCRKASRSQTQLPTKPCFCTCR